jgi:hypothetical protein
MREVSNVKLSTGCRLYISQNLASYSKINHFTPLLVMRSCGRTETQIRSPISAILAVIFGTLRPRKPYLGTALSLSLSLSLSLTSLT